MQNRILTETLRKAEVDLWGPAVLCDDLHMNQIFIDLLSDDRKFTTACGSVLIRFEQLAEAQEGIAQYRLAVQDSGIGRSEEFPLTFLMPSGGSAPPPWPDLRAPD